MSAATTRPLPLRASRPDGPEGDVRRRTRWVFLEWSAIGSAPVVLFWLLRMEPFFRQNGLDPFVYIGFSAQPGELIRRFGLTYYAVRFGLLWPVEITTSLFGVGAGYFGLRWALAAASGGALYWYFRDSGRSRGLGACVTTLYWTSPVLLRALMTTYADTTAIPYLVIGSVALLAVRRSRNRLRPLSMAGFFFALAINSHPFVVTISGAIVVGWAISEWSERRVRLAADLAAIGVTVAAVTAIGSLVYGARFGTFDILSPSLDAATMYSGKAAQTFRSPTGLWRWSQLQLYLPPLALASLASTLVASKRRPDPDELAVMAGLGLALGYLLVQEFVQEGVALETYYYSSYLLPATVITLGLALRAMIRPARGQRLPALLAAGTVGLLVLRNAAFPGLTLSWMPWVPGLVILVLVLTVRSVRQTRHVLSASVALVVTALAFTVAAPTKPAPGSLSPTLGRSMGNADTSGLDLYRLTYQLMAFTPPLDSAEGHLLFWFPSDDPVMGAIEGAYLAGGSSLQAGGEGMPTLSDWHVAHLRDEQVTQLVLAGRDRAEVERGTLALLSHGVGLSTQRARWLRSGRTSVYAAVMAVDLPAVG